MCVCVGGGGGGGLGVLRFSVGRSATHWNQHQKHK